MASDDQELNDLIKRLDSWAAQESTPNDTSRDDALSQKQRSQLWHLCNQSSGATLSHPLIR